MNNFLPYGRQTIDADDVDAVVKALQSPMLTTGPLVEAYEAAFAETTNAAHAVASNSGTAALHLAVLGLQLNHDETVIVPAITFLATANVVRMMGARVYFADVDPETGLMTPETFSTALRAAQQEGHHVVGVIPVHLNGQVCDMPKLASIADEFGIWLIEDACHALGAANIGASPGSSAACFSTHPVKGITTAEGGVTTTPDPEIADRMRILRSHGMIRDPAQFQQPDLAIENGEVNSWYYEMHEIGWNYRLPDVLCALGLSQLRKLSILHAARERIAHRYNELLAPLAPSLKPVPRDYASDGWHLYPMLVDFDRLGRTRNSVMHALRDRNIGTQVHYIPVHKQPYYQQRYPDLELPGAMAYYRRCMSVPFFATMSDDDVSRVVDELCNVLGLRN